MSSQAPKSDPGSTPRIGKAGEAKREPAIFDVRGDDWLVVVTPIAGIGRAGVTFELRAEFVGPILAAFEHARRSTSHRRETWHHPDAEAARQVAAAAVDRLRQGERDLFLPAIAAELGHEAGPAGGGLPGLRA